MNPFEFFLGKPKPSSGARPGWPPRQGKFPSTWSTPKPSAPVNASTLLKGTGSFIPKGSGSLLGPIGTAATAVPTVLSIINPKDNIFTDLQNLGTSIQNQFVSPGQRRGYVGSDPAAVAANRNLYSGVIGSIPPSANGETYRRTELRLDDAARSGGGGGGGGNAGYSVPAATSPGYSPAAERVYAATKSSVAQQAAQNPEFQRYEEARKGAKTQEDMNAARDIGMQIWQNKYGGTKMGQQGGAVGTFNPLMDKTFGYQTGGAPDQQMGAPTMGPSPLVPQVDQSLNPASPTYLGGEGPPLMNFADDNLTPEMIEAYQKQLLSQAASRK